MARRRPRPCLRPLTDWGGGRDCCCSVAVHSWGDAQGSVGGEGSPHRDTVGIARLSEAEAMTWAENMVVPANEWPLTSGNIVVQD
jgi:hypothetical protein